MGAEDKSCDMGASTLEEVRARLKDLQEHDRMMYGADGYSGGWHLCYDGPHVKDLKLPNLQAVWDWERDHPIEKRCVVFVSYYTETKTDEKARQKFADAVNKAHTRANVAEHDAIQRFEQAKSAFVGCKDCKARLPRRYVRNAVCPCCKASLLSPTAQARIKQLREKTAAIRTRDYQNKGKLGWVILASSPM